MTGRLADVAAYDGYQRQRTEEDVEYILDFLGAALYVDDASLFRRVRRLAGRDPRAAQHAEPGTVARGLDIVADVIAAEPGPYDRALDILRLGQAAAAA